MEETRIIVSESYCKITFELDGTGIYHDPFSPIHLDALLAWALLPMHKHRRDLTRFDVPDDIPLPLARKRMGGTWIWRASVLFPDEGTPEDMRHWRKKFRENRAELTDKNPNLTNATYREWNQPMPVLLARSMTAYAVGKPSRIRQVLKRIRYIGKKRSMGLGKVVGVSVELFKHDWSCYRDGVSMRWLPDEHGTRIVRPRPPYWSPIGAVPCVEVGGSV